MKGITEIYNDDFLCYKPYKSSLYKGFFVSSDICGSLYETEKQEIFLLITKDKQYKLYTQHFNQLVIYHYIYSLKDDIQRYIKYNESNKVTPSSGVLENYTQQIELFEKQAYMFIETFQTAEIDSYEYTQQLKYLIATYASLRTILIGNCESLYDSKNSHNFLLLGITDLKLSSYRRVKTWLIENQEHYVFNLLQFNQKDSYNPYLTSSGMQAIGMSLEYLLSQKRKKILIIGPIYFETIKLIENYFGEEDIIFFDTKNGLIGIEKFLLKYSPDIIIADSVTLSFSPYVLTKDDFTYLITQIKNTKSNASIILDVSTKYLHLEDYSTDLISQIPNEIIFVASLVKYLYGGMDLGFGGYALFPKNSKNIESIFSNSGVGINNNDALKIPLFSIKQHDEIISKVQKKLNFIHKKWLSYSAKYQQLEVNFMGVSENLNQENNFYGNLINIGYKNKQISNQIISKNREDIVNKIMHISKLQNLDVSYSTGYGYNNTRIVIFTCESVTAIPIGHSCYIRISVGHASKSEEVYELIKIVCSILSHLEKT